MHASLEKYGQILSSKKHYGTLVSSPEGIAGGFITHTWCACSLSRSVVSDSLRPRGLQPTRFFYPWDFPGKSPGAGYHFLLQGIFPTKGFEPESPTLAGGVFTTKPCEKPFI